MPGIDSIGAPAPVQKLHLTHQKADVVGLDTVGNREAPFLVEQDPNLTPRQLGVQKRWYAFLNQVKNTP